MKMFDGDGVFAQRATHTTADLKQPEGQARNPSRPLGDFGQDSASSGHRKPMLRRRTSSASSVSRVELEPQDEPHPVPQRLQEVRLVRCGQQQREVGEGNRKRRAARFLPFTTIFRWSKAMYRAT